MDAIEIIDPLRRMFDAMRRECQRIERLRQRHGRWNVPVSKAECTVVWFASGTKPEPGVLWPAFKVPNAKAVGLDAAGGQSHTSDGLAAALPTENKA